MSIENIQFNKSAISVGECVSKGWEIVKPNYLMFLAIGILAVILGCIPVVSWFLVGPIFVGVYAALLKQYQGEQAGFWLNDVGFQQILSGAGRWTIAHIPGGSFEFLQPRHKAITAASDL